MNDPFPPRLVFDDGCGFCTWCAEYAAARGEFEVVGFSDLSPDQLARLPDEYESCFHLLTQERVYSCGEALEEVGVRLETPERLAVLAFRQLPNHETLRESGYRLVADNRVIAGKVVSKTPPSRKREA